jgi:hypothetical protein
MLVDILTSDAAIWVSAAAHCGVDHKAVKAVLAATLVLAGIPETTIGDEGGDAADGIADRIWRHSPTAATALAAQLVNMVLADESPDVELR